MSTASMLQAFHAWLRKDARNRALRTLLQTIAAGAVIAAGDVLRLSLAAGRLDLSALAHAAVSGALTALLAAAGAYLQRTRLDPSSIPSATPPVIPAALVTWATGHRPETLDDVARMATDIARQGQRSNWGPI